MTKPKAAHRGRHRFRWILPGAVVAVWLVLGGIAGPYTGALGEVAENDNAAFLPATAESTEAAAVQKGFVERQSLPAIIVWEHPVGVSAEARQEAARQIQAVADIGGVAGPASPPILASDGQAMTAVVPLDAAQGDELPALIGQIRETVADADGSTVYVTGPAGVLADFTAAFEGIDGILLGVALAGVLVILLVVYRSPLLPFVVLVSALLGLGAAACIVYLLADADLLTLNGQSQGILFILVVGAATDYALLLVARFREELRREGRHDLAMRTALRQVAAPIAASAGTVILAVLCLLVSDLNSSRSLGPVAALGIAAALLVSLTFLPALLALLGRAAFWPFRPVYGSDPPEQTGLWGRIARAVSRRPRTIWVAVSLPLVAMAALLSLFRADGVAQTDLFLDNVESKQGQQALDRHFPGGTGAPAVVITPTDQLDRVVDTAESTRGVDAAAPLTGASGADRPDAPPADPRIVNGRALVEVTLADAPDSLAALEAVRDLRANLHPLGPGVLVGGPTAEQLDTNDIAKRDRTLIIPIVLVVILAVLVALLRAVVAPLLLVATVVLSFAATLGFSALIFNEWFNWPGADPSTPLLAFVFLVALGIDYNIFLMTRVREEAVKTGTRPGILRGLTVTGGVITSTGLVLAATFSALGVIPLLFLAQIAFLVAFGVLLDTFIIRSLLVPAICYDIGGAIWWPARRIRATPAGPPTTNRPTDRPRHTAGARGHAHEPSPSEVGDVPDSPHRPR